MSITPQQGWSFSLGPNDPNLAGSPLLTARVLRGTPSALPSDQTSSSSGSSTLSFDNYFYDPQIERFASLPFSDWTAQTKDDYSKWFFGSFHDPQFKDSWHDAVSLYASEVLSNPTPEKIQHFLEDTGLTLNPNASDEDGLMFFKNDKNFPNPRWILNNVFRKRPPDASD